MKCFWLFTVSKGPGVMIVNIGTRVAPVNIAFSSSSNAALLERKMLQYTTLSIKLHHCTLSEIRKTQIFTMSVVLACVSVHCADQRQDSFPDFLTKSIDNALQTCVDIANEYLQAYNIGVCAKKTSLFGVCMNLNVQFIQGFC